MNTTHGEAGGGGESVIILSNSDDLEKPSDDSLKSSTRKDLERFIKFFVIKSTQIIVQSRVNNGKLVRTECRLPGGRGASDWFNLEIPGQPHPLTPPTAPPLQILIHLTHHTQKKLLLEIWRITETEEPNPTTPTSTPTLENSSNRTIYNVYNKMSMMLKTLISVSRVTPAYKLSRRMSKSLSESNNKSDEDYSISYEIGQGSSCDEGMLGQASRVVHFGELHLPGLRNLSVELRYRTKMELNLTCTSLLIKSDHYGGEEVGEEGEGEIRPAFYRQSEGESVSEEVEDVVPFLELVGGSFCGRREQEKPPPPPETTPSPEKPHQEEKPPEKERTQPLTTPFFPTTPTTPNTSSSASNDYDLLTTFEEFRIAPPTLQCFDNEQLEEKITSLPDVENTYGHQLQIFDDFLSKLEQES